MITSILSVLNLNNIKNILILVGFVLAVVFWKDYQFQRKENGRIKENAEWQRKFDSLKFRSETYTKKEIEEYLEYNRKDLQDFLKKNNIKTKRIEQIISQKQDYRDKNLSSIDLSPLLKSIEQNKEARVPVVDSTDCLIVRGYVVFKKDTLRLDITDRQFKNMSDVVSYWQRRQWSFLGIKTRFLGKRETTVIIKDACGKTETIVINKKNKI